MDPGWLSNAYLLADEEGGTAVYVDSGAPLEPLLEAAERWRVQPMHVLRTHGHPDHIGGLTEGGKPVFKNARYVFGAAEFDFWKRGENVREARKFNRELFVKICLPLAERSTFIKPGDEVVAACRVSRIEGGKPLADQNVKATIIVDGKRLDADAFAAVESWLPHRPSRVTVVA